MGVDAVLPVVLIISIFSLVVAGALARQVLSADAGKPEMRGISDAIREGAEAFLRRQYRTIAMLAVVAAAVIFGFYFYNRGVKNIAEMGSGTAFKVTLSFIVGALCSGIAGYIGMFVSIRANIRTAAAAMTSLNRALQIALRGGAVSGLTVVAMSLLGVGGLFYLFGGTHDYEHVPLQIVGFGFGASFVALFAQLGGGIYTKAADVGADLVGKVEAGIPEDDPRNPAVIADLVGDNVGDCAGRGADLFESTAAENIGAMILGAALASAAARANVHFAAGMLGVMLFPLVARAFGLVASIIGVMAVRTDEREDPMRALNRGYYITSVLALVGFAGATRWLLYAPERPNAWLLFFLCGLVGIATAQAFVYITQYYTEYRYRPVREIAEAAQTGPATTIITSVDIARPEIWVGGLLGAMLVFLFSALAIRAVSKAAFYVINDVRAQFKEKPGILAGTERPDYRRCVDIVTRGALREMVLPGVLAVGMPIVTGILFRVTFHVGAEAVAALLMVGTMSGILMATLLNNGGGAWDNAKKYIEMGHYGGKGSPAHKAAVIGDTVGDPFKDTAGPSIHVLIKLLSTITLVMAPLFI